MELGKYGFKRLVTKSHDPPAESGQPGFVYVELWAQHELGYGAHVGSSRPFRCRVHGLYPSDLVVLPVIISLTLHPRWLNLIRSRT